MDEANTLNMHVQIRSPQQDLATAAVKINNNKSKFVSI